MKIKVKLYAILGTYLPEGARKNEAEIDVADAATVAGVLDSLSVPEEHCHLVLVNGSYVEPSARTSHALAEGDALAVWPPVAGG